MSVLVAGVTRARIAALCCLTAAAGKIPRAPATAAGPTGPALRAPGVCRRPDEIRYEPAGPMSYARPARSSASVPARSEARRSSRVKPAGASVSVVTPAAA